MKDVMNIQSNSQAAMSRNQTHGFSQLNQPSTMQSQFGQSMIVSTVDYNTMLGQNQNNTELIKRLTAAAKKLNQEKTQLTADKANVEMERDRAVRAADDLRNQLRGQDTRLAEIGRELTERTAEVTSQQNTINTLQLEKGELENSKREVATRLANVERNLNTKQEKIDRLSQAKNQLEQNLQTANETIRLATEYLRKIAGLIALIRDLQLPVKAGLDDLIEFVDANISAASWQVEVCKQQKEKVEELEEELKKVKGEKETLQSQLNNTNLEKEQLAVRVQELEGQIAQLQQQNEDRNGEQNEFNGNGNQIDHTQLIDDDQIDQRSGSVDQDNDNFNFPVPVLHHRSAASLRPEEVNEIGRDHTVVVEKIGTDHLKNLFDSNTMQSCNEKSFKTFEVKAIGNGNESVSKKKAEVDADITYLEEVIKSFIKTFEGATLYARKRTLTEEEKTRKDIVESFAKNMQGLLNTVKNLEISKAERWILLHFQLECAYQELNPIVNNIKQYKVELPEVGSCSIASAFVALRKAGLLK